MQREWTVCRLCFKKCVPKEYSTNTNGNVNQNNIFDVNNDSSSQFSYSLFQTSQETSTHFHKMIMSICSVQVKIILLKIKIFPLIIMNYINVNFISALTG